MDKEVELSVHGIELNYARNIVTKTIRHSRASTILFFFLLLVISVVLFFLQISNNRFFNNLAKYVRIKKNLSSWKPLVIQKSKINGELGKHAALNRPDLLRFKCMDFGNYILPIRLNGNNFLPEAVRRGEGDGWMVKKAGKEDPAAEQYCEYILNNYKDTITCGNQMFNILGYSGYFETGHWCQTYLDLI
ncbi:ORF-87 [Teiidae poxvirus 1]|nr:ORF-87 [Teiidae poxvirus 1]